MFDELINSAQQKASERIRGRETIIGEDGLRYCPVCGKALEAIIPSLGRRTIRCACEQNQDEQARAEQAEKQRLYDVERQLSCSPLFDPSYRRYTFASDEHEHDDGFKDAASKSRRYVEHFAEMQEECAGLLFAGTVGTGKTFYAASIVNALIDKGVSALIVSTSRLLNVLKASREPQEIINGLNEFSLVVLDDLGAERTTDYTIEQLEDVVDARALAQKPLIVTTNLPPQEIRSPSDLRLRRLFDRVNSLCQIIIPLTHESLRASQARSRADRAKAILCRDD